MPVLTSSLNTADEVYQQNRRAQLAALAALDEQLDIVRSGGGQRYVSRHTSAASCWSGSGIELLLDRDSPFLELSALAAWGTEFTVGASVVTGIGVVSGVECLIIGHDPTVRGGAMNPYSLKKTLRALDIARENRLPVINLVESGGADLPTQSDLFVPARAGSSASSPSCRRPGCPRWRWCSATRRRAVPTCRACATTRSWSTARAKVFLGGPPLVKMATGEDADDEAARRRRDALAGLGPVRLLRRRRARRDPHRARRSSRPLNWRKHGPRTAAGRPAEPLYDPEELLGIVSADFAVPFDPREVLARIVDGSELRRVQAAVRHVAGDRLGARPRLPGRHPGQPPGRAVQRGGHRRPREFILLANQSDIAAGVPAEHHRLHGRHGLRAGRHHQGRREDDQRRGQQRRAARDDQHRGLVRRRQLRHVRPGLRPPVVFAWPNARLAVMGAAQLAGVLSIVAAAVCRGPPGGRSTRQADEARREAGRGADREPSRMPSSSAGKLYDDGVIDPRDTRHRARHVAVGRALRAS